ncbi:MAG: hypothetical protein ACON4U_15965 [Myxococcota bacterium]
MSCGTWRTALFSVASTQPPTVLMVLLLWFACSAERKRPVNEVVLSGERDLWHFQDELSLSLSRHHSIATVVNWTHGHVEAQCVLGPDLLDVKLSPDGEHIAWLDRKSLHVVRTDNCNSKVHPWSTLWPSAPPAPVQIQWADKAHVVSHSTPPIVVPVFNPSQSRSLGQPRKVPISSMHSAKNQHYCGDSKGVVFVCGSGEVLFEFTNRIASVYLFQGQVCGLSTQSLRCGTREWSVSSLDLRYPELFATAETLWILDRAAVGSLVDSRWFKVDSEKGPEAIRSDDSRIWPLGHGWLRFHNDHLTNDVYSVPVNGPLELSISLNIPSWQTPRATYSISKPVTYLETPDHCRALRSLNQAWVCEQTDQLSWLSSNEKIMDLEPKRTVQSTGSRIAIWQRGQVLILEGHTKTVYPLNVRHQVSVFHLGLDEHELFLGTTTGSILKWQPEHSSWKSLAAFPDKVVGMSVTDSEVLVALDDDPFVIVGQSVDRVGTKVVTSVAANGRHIALAERYGGLGLMNKDDRCEDALGVDKLIWIEADTIIWGGLTSGVWRLGSKCRRLGNQVDQLIWLDTQQPVTGL